MKRIKILRFSLHEKITCKELFSVRWNFRENRKGVINEKRTRCKRLNILNEDCN